MLFFANVATVRDAIMQAVADADPSPTVILLDLGLTPEVDVPVVEALEHLQQRLAADGIELWLSDLRPDAQDLLDRAGALAAIGPDRIYPRVIDGILAFALRTPGADERLAALMDLLAFIRERKARPGESAEGAELLTTLEERLSLELAAAGGARVSGGGSADRLHGDQQARVRTTQALRRRLSSRGDREE
jgi:hypothetical protein